jgi:phosphatidylglycerophosphate synthase
MIPDRSSPLFFFFYSCAENQTFPFSQPLFNKIGRDIPENEEFPDGRPVNYRFRYLMEQFHQEIKPNELPPTLTDTLDTRAGSWNRRLARLLVRPFVGSILKADHITAVRVATGLASCYLLAFSDSEWKGMYASGALWIISALLDRCDGEFARMTGTVGRVGKIYDFIGDIFINTIIFLAIGIRLAHIHSESYYFWIGLTAATGVAVGAVAAEVNELRMANGRKSFNGRLGFDFDDLIYLIALFIFFDGLIPLVVSAAIVGPMIALVIIGKIVVNSFSKR